MEKEEPLNLRELALIVINGTAGDKDLHPKLFALQRSWARSQIRKRMEKMNGRKKHHGNKTEPGRTRQAV